MAVEGLIRKNQTKRAVTCRLAVSERKVRYSLRKVREGHREMRFLEQNHANAIKQSLAERQSEDREGRTHTPAEFYRWRVAEA